MLFDEFCECTDDLSTDTEIEMKKYTKRNILEQRKKGRQRQSHRRSIAEQQPIDRQELQRRETKRQRTCRSIAVYQPIDRQKFERKAAKVRELADRSPYSSRSIGTYTQVTQNQRRSIGRRMKLEAVATPIDRRNHPIDRQILLMQNVIVFQTFMTPNFNQN